VKYIDELRVEDALFEQKYNFETLKEREEILLVLEIDVLNIDKEAMDVMAKTYVDLKTVFCEGAIVGLSGLQTFFLASFNKLTTTRNFPINLFESFSDIEKSYQLNFSKFNVVKKNIM
jgi:hypothetical protein